MCRQRHHSNKHWAPNRNKIKAADCCPSKVTGVFQGTAQKFTQWWVFQLVTVAKITLCCITGSGEWEENHDFNCKPKDYNNSFWQTDESLNWKRFREQKVEVPLFFKLKWNKQNLSKEKSISNKNRLSNVLSHLWNNIKTPNFKHKQVIKDLSHKICHFKTADQTEHFIKSFKKSFISSRVAAAVYTSLLKMHKEQITLKVSQISKLHWTLWTLQPKTAQNSEKRKKKMRKTCNSHDFSLKRQKTSEKW